MAQQPDRYLTIDGSAIAEIVEKKSRFIGHVFHVATEEEALEALGAVRAEHRMARHNVYAYVLRNGRVRYSDDGEPSQTAGMPTLEAIQHAGLVDVAIVTTRYFGGVLLGTGGLVRAYTQAAQAAIEAAHRVTITRCVDIVAEVPYHWYEQTLRIADDEGVILIDSNFAAEVLLTFRAAAGTEDRFLQRLTELTRGQVEPIVGDPLDAAL